MNSGIKLVYKRVFTKEFIDVLNSMTEKEKFDVLKHERQQGIDKIKKMIPGSAFREYCNCCYGNGPDISPEFYPHENPDGSFSTDFYVNFDYKQGDSDE